MPTFDTPNPIAATIGIVAGDVHVSAGDRATTVVTVEPSDASDAEDRRAAEQTRVEYGSERLLVKAPRHRSWRPRRSGGSISVAVELPAGSSVNGEGALADFSCDGPLADCRITTGLGQIRVASAGTVHLKIGKGDVSVDHVAGHAEIGAGSGEVRVRRLDATGVIKNTNGDTWVGAAAGELRLYAANGDIAVDRADAAVTAKSANGDVRVGDVARGSIELQTRLGDLEVGIREGSAAWLDVRSRAGRVRNALEATEAPEPASETVEVRAHTTAGDVLIRRP
jgi:hypothetical protein